MIFAAIIVASGCANPVNGNGNGNTGGPVTPGATGNGLEIDRFEVVDQTMSPGQESVIILNLKNYHPEEEMEIQDISLYNTGELETEFQSCDPGIGNLQTAREEFRPEMECRWRVTAPSDIGGFDEREESLNLYLEYDSILRTQNPLEIQFQPLSEINSTSTASFNDDNGEISVSLETESPVPTERTRTLDITANSVADGRIDGNYRFEFTPESIVQNCDDDVEGSDSVEKKPVVDNEVELTCELYSENPNNRQLYVSTYYKYIKEPSLGITLVNE